MRLRTASIFLFLAAAAGEACSFFIPFDEYSGTPNVGGEGGPPEAGTGDGGTDAADDGGDDDDTVPVCQGIDTKSDPLNCGACGRVCANDGGCEAGRCPVETVYAASGAAFESFGVTTADGGSEIYFTRADGTLGRLFVVDGGVETTSPEYALGADAAAGPMTVTGNGGAGAFFAGNAGIESFRGPTFTTSVPGAVSPASGLTTMNIQGFVVFWGDSGGMWWKDTRTAVAKSGPVVGTDVPVAIDGTQAPILWWTSEDGTAYKMDSRSPGFAAQIFDAGLSGGVESIAVTKKYVVLGQKSQGLRVYTLVSTGATFLRPVAIPDPQVLATDEAHVYALDLGTPSRARLLRILPDGTEFILLADQFVGTHAIALDGDWVYYADGPKILRTSK
jgi:hypothetical protein